MDETKKTKDSGFRELARDVIKKAKKTASTMKTDPPPTPQPKKEEPKG